MLEISAKDLYQRQTTLREIGAIGQNALRNATITIVGCGGLGSVAAVYLAASGIGNIHLVDFDLVDVSNLHRQVFYRTEDIGKLKVEVLSNHIQSISPLVNVTFSNETVLKNNVKDIISTAAIVLDCTDDLPTKYLLNDTCVVKDKVLVYGSLYKFDGYVATFNFMDKNGNRTTNLRDAFPEIPTKNIPNCSEIGTLNSIVGIIGLMQANEVLKVVANIGKPIVNELLIYNSLENTQYKMKLKPLFDKEKISEMYVTENYEKNACDINDSLIISQVEFKKLLVEKRETILVISLLDEMPEVSFTIDENVQFYDIDSWLEELKEVAKEYIMVCNRGNNSMMATLLFKEKYPQVNVLSLEGGVLGF